MFQAPICLKEIFHHTFVSHGCCCYSTLGMKYKRVGKQWRRNARLGNEKIKMLRGRQILLTRIGRTYNIAKSTKHEVLIHIFVCKSHMRVLVSEQVWIQGYFVSRLQVRRCYKSSSQKGTHAGKNMIFVIFIVSNCACSIYLLFYNKGLRRYVYITRTYTFPLSRKIQLNKKRRVEQPVQRLSCAFCSSSFIGHLNLEMVDPIA